MPAAVFAACVALVASERLAVRVADLQQYVLAPFDLQISVELDDDVWLLENIGGSMPDKVAEMAPFPVTVTSKGVNGKTVTLTATPGEFDARAVISKAQGPEKAQALDTIKKSLGTMSMSERFADIETKIGENVRASFMRGLAEKLPEKVKEKAGDFLKGAISALTVPAPPAPPAKGAPVTAEPLGMNAAFKVSGMRWLKRRMFKRKASKLLTKGFQEKTGGSLQVDVTAEETRAKEIILRVKATKVDLFGLVSKSKGEDFSKALSDMTNAMKTMGVDSSSFLNKIQEKIMAEMKKKISDMLSSKLKAKVEILPS